MSTQLAFSWRSAAPARRSDGEEGVEDEDGHLQKEEKRHRSRQLDARRVQFAVQNVPPSPLVYHAHRDVSPYSEALTIEAPQLKSIQSLEPAKQLGSSQKTARRSTTTSTRTAKPSQPRKSKPRLRPSWDDQVARDSGLFDTSLMKASLFHARPGDRMRQIDVEQIHLQDRPSINTRSPSNQSNTTKTHQSVRKPSSMTFKRRETQSSGYIAPRSYRLPSKPRKDYVKQNIEQITGRPIQAMNRQVKRGGRPKNVFDRLYEPRPTDLAFRALKWKKHEQDQNALNFSLPDDLGQRAMMPINSSADIVPSPLRLGITDNRSSSIEQETQLENQSSNGPIRIAASTQSPPTSSRSMSQSPKSVRSRTSPGSRTRSLPSAEVLQNKQSRGQTSYPARVFAVLDRNERKRIGVDQILQGLRLLGLPATHNQISDYVYLIHDGRCNTIDLEEWEILVGTLDAASRPVEALHSLERIETHSQRSAFSLSSPGQGSLETNSLRNSHLGSKKSPMSTFQERERDVSPSESASNAKMVTPHPLETDDLRSVENDPAAQSIQRYVDEMCHQASAAASLHWDSANPKNNQTNDVPGLFPGHMLNRAAAVVYNLKASLFPLVHQAEEALRDIHKRHGCKLSLILSPEKLKSVAQNSEALSWAILDDILLDTVQLLNEEETQHSQRLVAAHHVDQLDDILLQIQQIEEAELQLLSDHAMPSFKICATPATDPVHVFNEGRQSEPTPPRSPPPKSQPSTVLPLEVIMNIKLSGEVGSQGVEMCNLPTQHAPDEVHISRPPLDVKLNSVLPAIKTSVLRGKRLQSIEKRRIKFLKHRRLVEAALADTGMAQSAVIEILEEMMVADILEEAAAELEDTVGTISDTVVANLL